MAYLVDKSLLEGQGWTLAGTNELRLDEIIFYIESNSEGPGSLDPVNIKKEWAGPPVNTELETETYKITGQAVTLACDYEGGIELEKNIPSTVKFCQVIRDSGHLQWDSNLHVVCY